MYGHTESITVTPCSAAVYFTLMHELKPELRSSAIRNMGIELRSSCSYHAQKSQGSRQVISLAEAAVEGEEASRRIKPWGRDDQKGRGAADSQHEQGPCMKSSGYIPCLTFVSQAPSDDK